MHARIFHSFIFTSNTLSKSYNFTLQNCNISILPPCLSIDQEVKLLDLNRNIDSTPKILNILFIGRLDTYKRLDILIKACSELPVDKFFLHVAGSGPLHGHFCKLARNSLPPQTYCVYGFVSEEKNSRFWLSLIA